MSGHMVKVRTGDVVRIIPRTAADCRWHAMHKVDPFEHVTVTSIEAGRYFQVKLDKFPDLDCLFFRGHLQFLHRPPRKSLAPPAGKV